MTASPYPTDLLKQIKQVKSGWERIDPNLSIGDLIPNMMEEDLVQGEAYLSEIRATMAHLTDLRNRRDAFFKQAWSRVKRVRSGIRGIYGDDSSQYEMVGGTRLSERKRPIRRKKAEG